LLKVLLKISPETLEYLASFATGGLGKLIVNSVTVADQAIDKDKKVDINKVPFLRKFYAVPREKAELQHLYKMYKVSGDTQFSPLERNRYSRWLEASKKDYQESEDIQHGADEFGLNRSQRRLYREK